MTTPILTTKLFIPPLREDRTPRPQLIEKLNESTAYPLTLVSASAGSGKTTTLIEWAAHSERPVAWISLDGGDNDPAQFLTYFIAALRSIQEGFGEEALETLGGSQADPLEMTLINLINEAAEFPEKFTLVLDDYHVITDRRTNELTAFMVDHIPPQMHFVVSSRIDPQWPLARYRARGQLYEIRGQDLRFSGEEAAEFLQRTMGLDLSAEDAAALEKRTEGWIAGLQLAALSMQGREDIPGFVKDFTGSHLYVAEYLVEEILKQQPGEMQSFLLQTSILERLNAGLCEAVSGCTDGQAILTNLHRGNVFVIPLDHDGLWFRYHHLFADLLQARLLGAYPKEEVAKLHGNAANWYEQNGHLVEAVQHTFSAGDHEKAAVLVDRVGQTMVFSERHNILKNWLDALPDEAYMSHPRLEIYRLMIDLSRGTLDMYEQTLLEKEELIKALPSSPENDRLRREALVNLALFYAFQNTSRAIQIAQEAMEKTPEGDLRLRPTLYSAFYRAYGMEGDIEKSAPAYRESLRLAEAAGQYGMISNTTMIRAFDLCQYGRLDEAAEYCRRIIDAGSGSKQRVFYPAGPAYIGLAGIHLERNDLEKAEGYLKRGLELCHQGAMHGLFTGYVQKSRLHQAKGELEESLKVLENLLHTFQRREFTLMAREVAIRLAVGDAKGISDLVPTLLEILGESHYARQLPLIAAESFKLSLARIYIALGEIEKAAQLLDEIQATVEPGKRYGRLMEVHLLRALALQKQDLGAITDDALVNLERALDLGEAPGFVMLLLEEGPALVPGLNAVVEHRDATTRVKNYALKILEAVGEVDALAIPVPSGKAAELVEQLTPREMEVLALVAAGDSNQAIADKLVITVRTVKKHTSNIYGKLNASSRTQAVARARELGLLPTDQ